MISTVAEVQSEILKIVLCFRECCGDRQPDFDYSVFWIQDQGAGEWSGLYVFVRENTAAAITVSRGDM